MAETKSNAVVLLQFFGVRDGQSKREFVQEINELGEETKQLLADGIRNETYTY